MHKTRRGFLKALGAGAAIGALGACTITKSGNVTTLTLNVAKVSAYAKAASNFIDTALSIPVIVAALGAPTVAIIKVAAAAISSGAADISSAANGSASVSYDNTDVKTAFTSIVNNFMSVVNYVKAAITGVESSTGTSSDLSKATTAADAAETILSLLEAMISVALARGGKMTEAQALRTLHVTP